MKNSARFGIVIIVFFSTVGAVALAQDTTAQPSTQSAKSEPAATGQGSGDALRKAAQNPIASLISVPLQNNANFGMEPGARTQEVLNIQPVIPVGINKDWNVLFPKKK